MGVDLRGFDARVTHQLLHGADIATGLEQMRGEAMAEGVAGSRLVDARGAYRLLYAPLNRAKHQVMAPPGVSARITRRTHRGKDVLPSQLQMCVRKLACERVRQFDAAGAV